MSETSFENEISKPRAWYTDLSSYYLGIERLLFTAIGILIVGYICFAMMPDMTRRTFAFVALTIAIIKLQSLANFFAGGKRVKITQQDIQILNSIRKADISEKKKRALIRQYFPEPSSRNAVAMSVLCWTMLLQLFLVYGLAAYLADLQWVKQAIEVVPTHIFFEARSSRTAADIPMFKVFKCVDLATIPFKLLSVYVLLTPFIKKHNVFPMVPSALIDYGHLSVSEKIRKILWGMISTATIIFFLLGTIFTIITTGYLEPDALNHDNNLLRSKLSLAVWKIAAGWSLFFSITACLFVRLASDWIFVIKNILIKNGVLNE